MPAAARRQTWRAEPEGSGHASTVQTLQRVQLPAVGVGRALRRVAAGACAPAAPCATPPLLPNKINRKHKRSEAPHTLSQTKLKQYKQLILLLQ